MTLIEWLYCIIDFCSEKDTMEEHLAPSYLPTGSVILPWSRGSSNHFGARGSLLQAESRRSSSPPGTREPSVVTRMSIIRREMQELMSQSVTTKSPTQHESRESSVYSDTRGSIIQPGKGELSIQPLTKKSLIQSDKGGLLVRLDKHGSLSHPVTITSSIQHGARVSSIQNGARGSLFQPATRRLPTDRKSVV